MGACKYCLQCESPTISAVSTFVDKFPDKAPDETEVRALMDKAQMDDWTLEPRSFPNMKYRLIPVLDENLTSLIVTSSGGISCTRTSDGQKTIHR